MVLVTLAEAKERLSIDFDTKDSEITGMINAIEGYLFNATGLDFTYSYITDDLDFNRNLAKEYVLLSLYLDYYNAHTEIDDLRLTKIMKQLQVAAL